MRWRGQRQSSNIEDRRGDSGGFAADSGAVPAPGSAFPVAGSAAVAGLELGRSS